MGVGLPPSACLRQNNFPSENMSAANRAPRAHSLYFATDDVRPSPAVLQPPDPPRYTLSRHVVRRRRTGPSRFSTWISVATNAHFHAFRSLEGAALVSRVKKMHGGSHNGLRFTTHPVGLR